MTRPFFPRTRIIREGERLVCRDCGSGRSAHLWPDGARADHRFNPPPFLDRHPVLQAIVAWMKGRDG